MTGRVGRKPGALPSQIAAMLRAGATYLEIKARYGVSTSSISAARKAYRIPLAPRALQDLPAEQQRDAITARYPAVAEALQGGATVAQIEAAGLATRTVIYKVRAVLELPGERRARTVTETLARYVRPCPGGHARWDGPTAHKDGTGQPQLWAHNRRYTPRREIFRDHHGRAPQGRVTTTCTYPGCLAAAHLADDVIRRERRQAQQLDAQYAAIFGPDAP
ncbi:hypothetical protein JHN59_41545 [Streptomyces sp. MBT49]|uniref:hypothetical protein n=1 Tax=Streptomyces sp. MBT49 TaxID=1488380 RepID=UPI00190DD526|nr:hypothetical protein [Streptomyces sp. MBT49]MBK3631157.1 hypothetical protein [Streptomyces sp. MBT49]